MSRIGKQYIKIPNNVFIDCANNIIKVTGIYGCLSLRISNNIKISIKDNFISVKHNYIESGSLSLWGLIRTLINNLIIGVNNSFQKKIIIVGIGYNARKLGNNLLLLTIGYSHEILYRHPKTVTVSCDRHYIIVRGCNKYLVGQVSSDIISLRRHNLYIDKGIRYLGYFFTKKEGKKSQ